MEGNDVSIRDKPYYPVVHIEERVYQAISERNDPRVVRYPRHNFRVESRQYVDRLSNDYELSLYGRLKHDVSVIRCEVLCLDELQDQSRGIL